MNSLHQKIEIIIAAADEGIAQLKAVKRLCLEVKSQMGGVGAPPGPRPISAKEANRILGNRMRKIKTHV